MLKPVIFKELHLIQRYQFFSVFLDIPGRFFDPFRPILGTRRAPDFGVCFRSPALTWRVPGFLVSKV